MTDEELQRLKSDVENLQNKAASKLITPEVIAELRARIAAIGDKMAMSNRVAKLEQEHTKYVSADVALELPAAG